MSYIWPTPDQLGTLKCVDPTKPVTMLNLLRYREQANYVEHPQETPCTGREAYQRYAEQVLPCVESVGGRVVFSRAAGNTLIGPAAEQWDDVVLVEYPSVNAFVEMSSSARYISFAHHRAAAIADSRLVPLAT